jgi:hypothetical protein
MQPCAERFAPAAADGSSLRSGARRDRFHKTRRRGRGGCGTCVYFTRVNVVVWQKIWPTQPDRSKAFLLVTVTAPK